MRRLNSRPIRKSAADARLNRSLAAKNWPWTCRRNRAWGGGPCASPWGTVRSMNSAQVAMLSIFWSLLAAEYVEASMVHEQGCNVHAAGSDASTAAAFGLFGGARPCLADAVNGGRSTDPHRRRSADPRLALTSGGPPQWHFQAPREPPAGHADHRRHSRKLGISRAGSMQLNYGRSRFHNAKMVTVQMLNVLAADASATYDGTL